MRLFSRRRPHDFDVEGSDEPLNTEPLSFWRAVRTSAGALTTERETTQGERGVTPPAPPRTGTGEPYGAGFARLRLMLGLLVALLVAAIGAETYFGLKSSHDMEEAEARRQTQNLAHTLEVHATAAIQLADKAVSELARTYAHHLSDDLQGRDEPHEREMLALFEALRRPGAPYRNIVATDAEGFVRRDGTDIPPTFNVSSNDWFKVHRDNPDTGLYISDLTRSRLNRGSGWFIAVSRRVDNPDGSFAGVAYAVIDLGYFEKFYSSLDVGRDGFVSLRQANGNILARHPTDQRLYEDPGAYARMTPVINAEQPGGSFLITPAHDNIRRMVTVRAVPDLSLFVAVGLAEHEYLAAWKAEAGRRVFVGVLACMLVVALVALLLNHLERREAAARAMAASEGRARASSDRLAALVGAIPDLAFLLDEKGRFVEVLAVGHDNLLAAPRDQLVGRTLADVLPAPVAGTAFEVVLTAIATGRPQRIEYRLAVPAGERWFEGRMAALPEGFGPTRMVIFLARDVTERVMTAERLRQAKDQAESANRAKSTFLATMSHELRTPLNAIIGFSEIMQHRMFGPLGHDKYGDYVRNIQQSGAHLLELINDVLDMSKLEAGRYALEERPLDLPLLVASCLDIAAAQAQAGEVALVADVAAGLPVLRADERALRQILLNLLSNAVKFTPAGGRVTLAVRLDRSGEGLEIAIADTGIGIDEEAMKRIAEPFHQADTSISRRFGGTGLGLAITRNLVELHGGRLAIDSAPGAGTTVTVHIPAARLAVAA